MKNKKIFLRSFFLTTFIALFFAQSISAQTRTYRKVNKLKETVEGEKLYSQGKYDDAIAMFKDALKKGETRGEPHYYIGTIHESRHQYEEAIPYFQEAVRRELLSEFREATLWKLIILLQKQESYAEMLTYIDLLEDMGIKHDNLKKFREEAEINLSPEKIHARQLIKDAKKITADWESENKGQEFWSAEGNDVLRTNVLEKYMEAVSLDDSLFTLYWEIASYYEKMTNYQKASQIYEKIISKNNDPQAYYKMGLIARKNGDFIKARESFLEALKNLEENSSIKYFLLVNLSQALYALADYENGIRYSKEAREIKADNDPLYDTVIYCLHLSGRDGEGFENKKTDHGNGSRNDAPVRVKTGNFQISELKHTCTSFINKNDLLKKDIRFITLYYYMLAEVNTALLDKSAGDYESKIRNIIEYYNRSMIPPALRNGALRGLQIGDSPESYEGAKWAALPLWCLARVDHVFLNLREMEASRELYITMRLYKKNMNEHTPDTYNENLAVVSSRLGLYDVSLSAYKLLKERNIDQEKSFLKVYLEISNIEMFQKEILDYINLHSDVKAQMINFLSTDSEVQKIPHEKLIPEIKELMGIEDKPPVEYESHDEEKQEKDNLKQ